MNYLHFTAYGLYNFTREARGSAYAGEAVCHCDAWRPPLSPPGLASAGEGAAYSYQLAGHTLVHLGPPLQQQSDQSLNEGRPPVHSLPHRHQEEQLELTNYL